jgi:hypothetical protein
MDLVAPTGWSGVEAILRIRVRRGIGRATYFAVVRVQGVTMPSTTSWATAQRVAAARLDTPILV